MDALVNSIVALSNDDDITQLKEHLSQHRSKISAVAPQQIDAAIAQLDVNAHTLGYIFLVYAKLHQQQWDHNVVLMQFCQLAANGSAAQVRLASSQFVDICRLCAEAATHSNRDIAVVRPLKQAIALLQPTRDHLTALHPMFLRACLLSRCYHEAESLLNDEALEINKKTAPVSAQDVMLYGYYGGMVRTGLKQYKKAMFLYLITLTCPANGLSAIALEAYKKYVLVSLIATGGVPSLPKYTSSVVQRHVKGTAGAAYTDFVEAYGTRSTDDLHTLAQKHIEQYRHDNNFGLIKQVIASLYQANIQRYTKVFLTLSLTDIKEGVKLTSDSEAEQRVLRMIENGELFATINQIDKVVSFTEDPDEYNTTEMVNRMHEHVDNAMRLNERIARMDEALLCDPAFIARTNRDKQLRSWDFEEMGLGVSAAAGMAIENVGEKGSSSTFR